MGFLTDLATHIRTWADGRFSALTHGHPGFYEPANINIQGHIVSSGNPHGTTKEQVGLGNVTNDAQMKKTALAVAGNIPVYTGSSGDELAAGYGVESTLAGGVDKIARADAVKLYIDSAVSGHVHRVVVPHTWTIAGEIKVASGDTDYICPFFIASPAGRSVKLLYCRHRINSGTSATVKLTKNGLDMAGFTGMSVTTNPETINPADLTLDEGDLLGLVVTAVSGTPKNMTMTLLIDYGVA